MTYPIYPTEIWDYLQDIPYMPSKSDREYILQMQDEKRLLIWEYFFRIKREDIGKPQKTEFQQIEQTLNQEIQNFNNQVNKDNEYLSLFKKETWKEIFKYSLSIIVSLLLWKLFFRYFYSYESPFSVFDCLSPFIIFDSVMLLGIVVAKNKEVMLIRSTLRDRSRMRLTLGLRQRYIFLENKRKIGNDR